MELKELLDHIKVGDSRLVHITSNKCDTHTVLSLVFENQTKEENNTLDVPDFMRKSGNYKEVM